MTEKKVHNLTANDLDCSLEPCWKLDAEGKPVGLEFVRRWKDVNREEEAAKNSKK